MKNIFEKLLANIGDNEYIIKVTQQKDQEFNKIYDVYVIETENNKYVVKKAVQIMKLGYMRYCVSIKISVYLHFWDI